MLGADLLRRCISTGLRTLPRSRLQSFPTSAPVAVAARCYSHAKQESEPKIIDAALRACRRLNDFASVVRILEAVKDKAGPHKEIYPYVIQELRPTLDELGISTPEELGLDKT
ncbi:cytochrome c oxidase subunit 5A, mitochondrial-like [Rhinophrynus dorsalis]